MRIRLRTAEKENMRILRTKRCKDTREREDFKEAGHRKKSCIYFVILPKFQDILSSFLIDLQAAVPSSQHSNYFYVVCTLNYAQLFL